MKPHGNDERSWEVVHPYDVFQENDGTLRLSGVLMDKVLIETLYHSFSARFGQT